MFLLNRDVLEPEPFIIFGRLGAFAELIGCRESFDARRASFVFGKSVFSTFIADVSDKSRFLKPSIVGQKAT